MGVEHNNVVLATTWSQDVITKVNEFISSLPQEFQNLFISQESLTNGLTTIVMMPDGSKLGWELSIEAENIRTEFLKLLNSFTYSDGSSPIDFVHVGYGELGQKIVEGNCKNRYKEN